MSNTRVVLVTGGMGGLALRAGEGEGGDGGGHDGGWSGTRGLVLPASPPASSRMRR